MYQMEIVRSNTLLERRGGIFLVLGGGKRHHKDNKKMIICVCFPNYVILWESWWNVNALGGELLTEDGEHSAAVEVKDEVGQMETLSLGRESPEDEEKDGMNSMFESLMADFDKHENEKFEYKPLYLRWEMVAAFTPFGALYSA